MTAQRAAKILMREAEAKRKKYCETYEQRMVMYRLAAYTYFPLQYLIIRWLTVGMALTPTLEDIIRGLNIEGVLSVATDFLSHLTGVFDAEHVIFIVFNLLPYALRLAVELIPAAAFCYAFYTLVIFFLAQASIVLAGFRVNIENVVTVRIGQPGSGKSSSAGYDAVLCARRMWSELRWKYWMSRYQVAKWKLTNNTEKLTEWYEIKDSYEYYITKNCVPCLFSNVPMQVNGQLTSILKYEHAKQIMRLPAFSVLYFDEVGSIFRVDMSNNKPLSVSDFFRLCRHFGDFRIICTEQDKKNIFIDVRRVVSENRYMKSQRWVNKPLLLLVPFLIIKLVLLRTDYGTETINKFMRIYYTLIRHIGQREYKSTVSGNTELDTVEGKRQRKKTFYLPPWLNYQYDDRTYRDLYLAKNEPIVEDIFPSLLLPSTEENKKRYLKSTQDKTEETDPTEQWFSVNYEPEPKRKRHVKRVDTEKEDEDE